MYGTEFIYPDITEERHPQHPRRRKRRVRVKFVQCPVSQAALLEIQQEWPVTRLLSQDYRDGVRIFFEVLKDVRALMDSENDGHHHEDDFFSSDEGEPNDELVDLVDELGGESISSESEGSDFVPSDDNDTDSQ